MNGRMKKQEIVAEAMWMGKVKGCERLTSKEKTKG